MSSLFEINGNSVILNINPKLYPLESVYSAAYLFLEKVYILLDGDPKENIIVNITPKKEMNLEEVAGDFLNELIVQSDYLVRAEKAKNIKEKILQKALFTGNMGQYDKNGDKSK